MNDTLLLPLANTALVYCRHVQELGEASTRRYRSDHDRLASRALDTWVRLLLFALSALYACAQAHVAFVQAAGAPRRQVVALSLSCKCNSSYGSVRAEKPTVEAIPLATLPVFGHEACGVSATDGQPWRWAAAWRSLISCMQRCLLLRALSCLFNAMTDAWGSPGRTSESDICLCKFVHGCIFHPFFVNLEASAPWSFNSDRVHTKTSAFTGTLLSSLLSSDVNMTNV